MADAKLLYQRAEMLEKELEAFKKKGDTDNRRVEEILNELPELKAKAQYYSLSDAFIAKAKKVFADKYDMRKRIEVLEEFRSLTFDLLYRDLMSENPSYLERSYKPMSDDEMVLYLKAFNPYLDILSYHCAEKNYKKLTFGLEFYEEAFFNGNRPEKMQEIVDRHLADTHWGVDIPSDKKLLCAFYHEIGNLQGIDTDLIADFVFDTLVVHDGALEFDVNKEGKLRNTIAEFKTPTDETAADTLQALPLDMIFYNDFLRINQGLWYVANNETPFAYWVYIKEIENPKLAKAMENTLYAWSNFSDAKHSLEIDRTAPINVKNTLMNLIADMESKKGVKEELLDDVLVLSARFRDAKEGDWMPSNDGKPSVMHELILSENKRIRVALDKGLGVSKMAKAIAETVTNMSLWERLQKHR
ncbi:MAG: hypothetical protein IKD08_04505 [Alphaproteobacteria bacterium]|nr:hypothetical protein [Alphaproteobacteria bacterium]